MGGITPATWRYYMLLGEAVIAYMDGDKSSYGRLLKVCMSDQVFEAFQDLSQESKDATVMKVATSLVGIPIEYRQRAKKWLNEHLMESWDDGDLTGKQVESLEGQGDLFKGEEE